MTARIEMSEPVRTRLLDRDAMQGCITLDGRKYTLHEPLGSGYKAGLFKGS